MAWLFPNFTLCHLTTNTIFYFTYCWLPLLIGEYHFEINTAVEWNITVIIIFSFPDLRYINSNNYFLRLANFVANLGHSQKLNIIFGK